MNDGFYTSIDKLVAFGLNSSLATSMIETMNQAIAAMQLPDYAKNNRIDMTNSVAITPTEKRFFVAIDEKVVGPVTTNDLLQMMANREVVGDTMVWYHGLPGWAKADDLSELKMLFAEIPPAL